jgi:hypothetical protein
VGSGLLERKSAWNLPQDGFSAHGASLYRMAVNTTGPHGDRDSSAGTVFARSVAKLYSGHQNSATGNAEGGSLGTGPQY